jgi:hypothetical protein
VEGVFETRAAGVLVRREEWKITKGQRGAVLACAGVDTGPRERRWRLEARLAGENAFESVDVQVTPAPPPTEITTTALRMYGGRAYGTTIPPEGVPEKFETEFGAAGTVRGFSALLDGLAAQAARLQAGHGKRLLVVDLEASDLRPRVRDALLLCKARARVPSVAGQGWGHAFDLRWADEPGRTETTFSVGKDAIVVRSACTSREPAWVTELVEFHA